MSAPPPTACGEPLLAPATAPFGAGFADGAGAPAHALDEALEGLAGTPAALVLGFCSGDAALEQLRELAGATPAEVPVAGMSGSGVIGQGEMPGDGCVVLALPAPARAAVAHSRVEDADLRGAAQDAVARALASTGTHPGHTLVLLFVDPTCGDQAEAVAGAYAAAGPGVPLAGGGAGGCVAGLLAGRELLARAVVAVAIVSRGGIGVGIAQGATSHPTPSIVTRAEGRALIALDGRPAEQVYLERAGCAGAELDDDAFSLLAALNPLAQPELRGQVRLRHVLGRRDGTLLCATAIPTDAAVGFAAQTPAAITRSARAAMRDAVTSLGVAPRAALAFDCAGRKRAAAGVLRRSIAAMRDEGGLATPLAGLYTHGEIGRQRGARGDRNHALVVVAFG